MAIKQTGKIIRTHFKDKDGEPFNPTPTQEDIFESIVHPDIKRLWVATTTQYGKSDIIGQAAVWLASNFAIKVPIIAGRADQAQIIMDYVVRHMFDHPSFQSGILDVAALDRLKTKKSVDHLRWKHGGEILVMSANAKQVNNDKQLMGFGGDIIIVDDADLIPDKHFDTILRMLGGRLDVSKLIQIGNPFFQGGHFHRAYLSDKYHKIKIDWKKAVEEGRLTQEYVDEMRENMTPENFKSYYEVEFPERGTADGIFTHDMVNNSKEVEIDELEEEGIYAGLDVSGVGDDNTVLSIIRSGIGGLELLSQYEIAETDTHQMTKQVHEILKKENITALGVDAVGIGASVADNFFNISDRAYEVDYYIAGAKAEEIMYYNKKTELIYRLRKLMEEGKVDFSKASGRLFIDLLGFGKKRMSDRKIKNVDPVDSPDYADSVLAAMSASSEYASVNIEFF